MCCCVARTYNNMASTGAQVKQHHYHLWGPRAPATVGHCARRTLWSTMRAWIALHCSDFKHLPHVCCKRSAKKRQRTPWPRCVTQAQLLVRARAAHPRFIWNSCHIRVIAAVHLYIDTDASHISHATLAAVAVVSTCDHRCLLVQRRRWRQTLPWYWF